MKLASRRSSTGRALPGSPLAIALLLLAILPVAARAQSPPDGAAPRPPGRLIDLGGYRIHLWCSGQGTPTVVLVPGAGDFSFGWAAVQSRVAKTTRVCSCDRGGMAWSDLGPRPRTRAQEAYDLRRALMRAGEPGPWLLVGQSLGGQVVRLLAAEHRDQVAGLVLVDAGHPDGMTNLNGREGTTRSFSRGRAIPAPRESIGPDDRLTEDGAARIQEAIAKHGLRPGIEPPYDRLPPDLQAWRLWALGQPKRYVAIESDYIGEEAERIHAENQRRPSPLTDLPLAVLSRDTTVEKSADPLHVVHQREVARLSRRGRFEVVRGASHHIHIDHPEAVVRTIERIVRETRAGGAGRTR